MFWGKFKRSEFKKWLATAAVSLTVVAFLWGWGWGASTMMHDLDLNEDTCDDILCKLVSGPNSFTPPAKRAGDACGSVIKRARHKTGSEPEVDEPPTQPRSQGHRDRNALTVTGSTTAADGAPAMSTGPTACATDVSAVARRKRACSDSAILPPSKRSIRNRPESIAGVCFAHSCPPLCGEGTPPDGEQSDDETHQARHGRCAKVAKGKPCRPRCDICKAIHECPRCSFKLRLPALQQCAAFEHGGCKLTWLAERQRSWPGCWAAGCILCYNLAQSLRNGDLHVPGMTLLLRGCSAWSRFLRADSILKKDVTQHARTELHQTALRFYQEPGFGLCPVVGDVSAPAFLARVSADLSSDSAIKKATAAHPFGPGVPQPDDYLRVWGHIRQVSSQRSCKEHRSVDRYSHDPSEKLGDKKVGEEPQRELSQIAFVMAEVIREDDRSFLRKATDCTLAMDASASKNVISFTAACATDDVVETRQGLLGIIDEQGLRQQAPQPAIPPRQHGGQPTSCEAAPDVSAGAPGDAAGGEDGARQGIDPIAEVRRKKSERGKDEVMQQLRQFHSAGCIDKRRVGIFNVRDFDHHREITGQTTFDGGTDAQCIGRLLAADPTCFPNTRSVVRDRAHAIRTNLKAPLASDPNLNRIKLQLMEKRTPWRSSFNTTLARKRYTLNVNNVC